MKTIEGITDQPKQSSTLILADGSNAVFNLEFRPNQKGWFFDLTWGSLSLSLSINGSRLVSSPNILRQFRERLPFGIAVVGLNNTDPLRVSDLSDGTVTLYLLDAADVDDIEATIYTGL